MLSHTAKTPMSARRRSTIRPPVIRVLDQQSTPHVTSTADGHHESSLPTAEPPKPVLPDSQTARDASLELVTEQLGWAPVSFVDDVVNAMNDLAYKGISSFEQWLEEYGLDEEEAEKGLAATETLFESNIDRQFDKFELFVLQSIFVVPVNLPIRLPHHEDVDYSVTDENEEQVDAELEELQRRLKATSYVNAQLSRALEHTEKDCEDLEQVRTHLSAISSVTPSIPATILDTPKGSNFLEMDRSASNTPETTSPPDPEFMIAFYKKLGDLVHSSASLFASLRTQADMLSTRPLPPRKSTPKTLPTSTPTTPSRSNLAPPSASTPEITSLMYSSIATAIERRRKKMDQIAQTPLRKRRQSAIGSGAAGVPVRNAKEGAEFAIEYRDCMAIGSAKDIQDWADRLDPSNYGLNKPTNTK
ncbi:Mis12 protein-domain-containing protein [Phlyctochytrium arcticum]|nr:Mis12 protein-domain-containing protein [Phlyctochytrium arcticum]